MSFDTFLPPRSSPKGKLGTGVGLTVRFVTADGQSVRTEISESPRLTGRRWSDRVGTRHDGVT